MSDHPSGPVRTRYLRGLLDPRQFLEVDDHLASCAECRHAIATSPTRAAAALRDGIAGQHLEYEQMEAYVDSDVNSEGIEDHVRVCVMCAQEIADLRREASRTRPRTASIYWIAAAAVVAMFVAAAVLLRQPEPPPARPPVIAQPPVPVEPTKSLDPALARVLAQLAAGVLPSATLVEHFKLQPERIRGGENETIPPAIVAPLGVIEDDRPLFRWTSRPGAPYVVEVFDGSYRRVARSDERREGRWQPSAPLSRGTIHSWQVREHSGITAPTPPAPPAQFKIIDSAALAELQAARAANDHLAAGIIYAREGAIDRAIEELAIAQKERPDVTGLHSAIATLRRYQPAPTTTKPPQ